MEDIFYKLDWVLPFRNAFLTPVAEFFTALGYAPFFLLLIPILYWAWNKRATNRVTVVLLISAVLNTFLKDVFQDPRPEAYFMEGHGEDSYGLPSGHTQLAIVFWYALAMEIGKRWAWIAASVFVVGIAFSRLYLGVHDLEDVLGGALLGVVALLVFRACLRHRERVPALRWLGPAGLAASIVSLFTWPNQIPTPDMAVLLVGFFLGWVNGVSFEQQRCGFEKKPGAGKTLLAVIVGLVGVVVVAGGLSVGLRKLVEAGFLWDYLAIGLGAWTAGCFIAFVAPCLFVKFGWMTEKKNRG